MARGEKKTPDLLGSADPAAFPEYLRSIAAKLQKSYEFVKDHFSGNSAKTYQIRSRSDKSVYCLKTVKPGFIDLARVRDTLNKEVEILRPLSHRCLPKVYDCDFAIELPFYVCTFHPGVTWAQFRDSGNVITLSEATYAVISLIDTLEYLHSQGRTHCDLHEANLLIGPRVVADGILIIDLGSGHRMSAAGSQTPDRGHLGLKPLDVVSTFHRAVERNDMNDTWQMTDYKALGRLLALMKEPFFGRANADQRDSLQSFAADLFAERISSWREVKARFEYVLDPDLLVTRSERYLQRRDGSRPHIPLPETGAVRVGDGALAVINTPVFQRLRGIKQLSFCEWYFPGATHTRFEHSLGVFSTTQQALRGVCRQHEVKARFDQNNVDGALLASLVHDIGHYPFAHVMEHYIAARYPHDDELKRQIHHFSHSLHLLQTNSSLLQAIDINWGEDVRHEAIKNLTKKCAFLSELLDGPIDCDKLDYLRRDAHHCGVPYGRSLNADEILSAYTCSPTSGELVIPEDRIAPIEGMIMAQDQMLSTVYWAKTTRALFAMFHRFLDIVVAGDTQKLLALVSKLKECHSDADAMSTLTTTCIGWAKKEHRTTALKLISLHRTFDFHQLYVPLHKYAVIDRNNPRLRGDENIYRKIVQHNIFTLSSQIASSSPINWELVKRLRGSYVKALKQKGIADVTSSDVLIDVPWGKPSTNMVKVLRSDGSEVKITTVSHIAESFFSLPAGHIAPIRVYVRPDLYARVAQATESLTKAAEEIFDDRGVVEDVE